MTRLSLLLLSLCSYALAQPALSANITVRSITVTATTNTKVYDGSTTAAAIPTITSGSLAGTDTANFVENYSTSAVGTGLTLVPSGSVSDGNNGANYAITFVNVTTGAITKAASSIVITAVPVTLTYGASVSLTASVPTNATGTDSS